MSPGPITTGPSLRRPAGRGVLAIDAGSGQPVTDGLRLTLLRRRDGRPLAVATSGPSGIHH
jgi:hypothetical protein